MSNSGMYMIFNKVNFKRYVGKSRDIEKRLNDHKMQLNKNIHVNKILQRDWSSFGSCAFEFKILANCLERDLILNRNKMTVNTYVENKE